MKLQGKELDKFPNGIIYISDTPETPLSLDVPDLCQLSAKELSGLHTLILAVEQRKGNTISFDVNCLKK